MSPPLELFHPLTARWFRERVGTPTRVQERAWPEIARGSHVLATAPTGSGKTLTAFLWAIDRLLTGAWEPTGTRVLYVSPLKALNNDVRRNLLTPLEELTALFRSEGVEVPEIRALTRSGDTPEDERRRMRRDPPEILITTPESLNILLTSKSGRASLGDLTTVILDEIHAVAGSKRGTHLATAVERLTLLSGEFQRIALSATVRPLDRVARFVGGWRLEDWGDADAEPVYQPRRVTLVDGGGGKRYDLSVVFPAEPARKPKPGAERQPARGDVSEDLPANIWEILTEDFKSRIRRNRSTLLFANSRRLTEKIARYLNEGEVSPLAYAHHGSLSRELRSVVEERLKEGRLQAIVATSSLELGIDVGALDEVLLVQTPPTIAAAVQRIGRAGHGVGEVSRGRLYPTFGRDFIDAAVVAKAVLDGEIEEIRPVENPLDVLAQVILSMVAAESWAIDDLYRFLRTAWPYRDLPRRWFDLVLDMLAGRYADSRVRELKPRVTVDRVDGTVRARRGADRLVYRAGGTIPDRGYYALKLHDSGAKIGELDEEFVWERSVGDSFHLGAQAWRIRQITHNDVLVSPARKAGGLAPFWRADERDRGFFLSEKIGLFLERAEAELAGPGGRSALAERLTAEHAVEDGAAEQLLDLLDRQRAATGVPLPHRRHLLVERVEATGEHGARRQLVLHTFWGGRVNRPFALALAAAWAERHPLEPIEILHDNDCVMVELPAGFAGRGAVGEVLSLVEPAEIERLLKKNLEKTGFFGAHFRQNAGRALLLPRAGFDQRVPLWLNRLRSKKLLEAVSGYEDFPLLVETWRTCLDDEMDLEDLRRVLGELAEGRIRVSEVKTEEPSPFAANLVWKQTNRYMYEDDTPEGGGSRLSGGLLRELVFSSQLRPKLPGELIDRFERKAQRTAPGYAPGEPGELHEWVRERLLIPEGEWRELLAAVARDGGLGAGEVTGWLEVLSGRLVRVRLSEGEGEEEEEGEGEGKGEWLIVAVETLPRLAVALGRAEGRGLGREEGWGVGLRSIVDAGEAAPPAVWEALGALPGYRGPVREGEEERDPLAALLGEWLRFYGPQPRTRLVEVLGLPARRVEEALEALIEAEALVVDRFRQADEETLGEEAGLEVVDAENLEILLRLMRSASRAVFEALPLEKLPLFLANHQGLIGRGQDLRDLQEVLEQLFGYPAPAGLWESDLLPARLSPYYPSWLDTLMLESDLTWVGTDSEKLTFAFAGELELFAAADGTAPVELFPAGAGRLSFDELAERSGLAPAELTAKLWELAWQGRVSNTTFAAVRKGLLARFALPEREARRVGVGGARPGRGGVRRRGFDRWGASKPYAGDWFPLGVDGVDGVDDTPDALELQELAKERVRQLLGRYGVLFRELLFRELPLLQWPRVFKALRLMELSGEVLSGHFFTGVPGLQFASHAAFRALRQGLPEDVVYWVNAWDPASPCGLGLEDLRGEVPARLPSTHLVFHGSRRVVTSKRNGAELVVEPGPDHPRLAGYLEFLGVLLTRDSQPLPGIDVEAINGEDAAGSPYARRLAELFSATREHKLLRLRRRY